MKVLRTKSPRCRRRCRGLPIHSGAGFSRSAGHRLRRLGLMNLVVDPACRRNPGALADEFGGF